MVDIFNFFKKNREDKPYNIYNKDNLINKISPTEVSYPPPSQIEKNVSLEFFLKRVCIPGSDEYFNKKNFLTAYMVYIDLFSSIIRLPWGTCALTEKIIRTIFQLLLLELYRNICKCEENLENIMNEIKYKKKYNIGEDIEERSLEYLITPKDLYFNIEIISSKNREILSKEDLKNENTETNIKQYYNVDLEILILSFIFAAAEFIQMCGMINTGRNKDEIHINSLKDIIGSLK